MKVTSFILFALLASHILAVKAGVKTITAASVWSKNASMQVPGAAAQNADDVQLGTSPADFKVEGLEITDDLKWNKNTAELVKKGYKRIQLLNAAASFSSARQDLKSTWKGERRIRMKIEKNAKTAQIADTTSITDATLNCNIPG